MRPRPYLPASGLTADTFLMVYFWGGIAPTDTRIINSRKSGGNELSFSSASITARGLGAEYGVYISIPEDMLITPICQFLPKGIKTLKIRKRHCRLVRIHMNAQRTAASLHGMHSAEIKPQNSYQSGVRSLSATAQDRKHV